jgi:origin recognition complex subunit 4
MMDANRSAKRRKLDTASHEPQKFSPASHSHSTPSTYSKKQKSGLKDVKSTSKQLAASKEPSASHLAWQEAKAKMRAQRGKRTSNVHREKGMSIYDDIEGAHGERDESKTETPSTTPQKTHLDPLRNQRSGASATSSLSKSGASLGFFKQFSKSHSQESPTKLKDTPEKIDGAVKHGSSGLDAQALPGVEAAESDQDDGEDAPPKVPGKTVWKGWAYANGPKKTLEDEIRELGNAAREQAGKDEDDGPASAASSSLRKRNKSSKFGQSEEPSKSLNRLTSVKSVTPKQSQFVSKLKQARKDAQKDSASDGPEAKDAMDIDVLDAVVPDQESGTNSAADRVQSEDPIKPTPQQRIKRRLSTTTTFSPEHMQRIQSILLQRLNRQRRTQLPNLDSEYNKLSTLITQTITAGESNSMLLIGSRGSGKSALVNQILHEQSQKYANDFHVVRLNGFIHTDDKIALREIWRQLGREMELEGDESTSKNYADTLTTLLALLSHPTELGQEHQAGQITKSVIFIIDEFDLFAHHPRQTLLYNLFDIAQSRKAPIAVLGLTTRIDVVESLEKRVKSRFSHRHVHLGLAKSFAAFQDACKAWIALHFDELSFEEREMLGAKTEVAEKLTKASNKQCEPVFAQWNSLVDDLLEDESFASHIRRIYYTTKSIPNFQASILLPVSTLPTEATTTAADLRSHFTTTLSTSSLAPPDSNLSLLHSLSTLHLALLICSARLTNIHATDVVPFTQAYEEYKVLASKQKLQASASGALAQGAGSRVWSKEVAKGAWEDLITFGLVIEDGSRGVRVDVGLEEIGMAGVELGSWGRWCREI